MVKTDITGFPPNYYKEFRHFPDIPDKFPEIPVGTVVWVIPWYQLEFLETCLECYVI